MLELKTSISLNREVIYAPNLTERFDEADLTALGQHIWEGYERDRVSRSKWEKRNEAGMDLALQLQKAKSFPWPGCSNIAFPLVTIGALQFHARAYPAMVQAPDPVSFRVLGEDPQGEETARAGRIGEHMSWQVLEEDESWEENHDKTILNTAIVGCSFKKTYYDATERHNTSEFVQAKDLVVDYWAKSLEKARRKTHIIYLYRNDIYERAKRGTFRNVLNEEWYTNQVPSPMPQSQRADIRQGITPPMPDFATPFKCLEQHCFLDLDQDGYAEPWIATIEEQSHKLLRLVSAVEQEEDVQRDGNGKIDAITKREIFTKYSFIPSPDGGLYDIGFGVLLGPLNESVNSLVNQLVDTGTMVNTAGGFLGRGAKIRGGVYTFSPLEWKRVDSTGDDLRKSIFPLPVREPSTVLYNLLGFLVNYTNRVSGATDPMVGENVGQNTPAETSRTMVTQGMQVYSAIFKRLWRSMKQEFRKLYVLNALHLDVKQSYGDRKVVLKEDYKGSLRGLAPSADPNITSDGEKFARMQFVSTRALAVPGYNVPVMEKRLLRALKIEAIDEIYPGPDKVPPLPNPKLAVVQAKGQVDLAKGEQKFREFVLKLREDIRLNTAKIAQLHAQAAKALEEAKVVGADANIRGLQAAIEALEKSNEAMSQQVELMGGLGGSGDEGGVGSVGGASGDGASSSVPNKANGAAQGAMGGGGVH